MLFESDLPGGDYEEVHLLQDAPSGLRAVLAIHSTRRGPAFGGIRRRAYPTQEDALADALALAATMTAKVALADLPAGGAKAVILDGPRLDPPAAYRALGRAIERLGGRYVCGPDVGTGEAELAHVRRATRHVNPEGNDANAATARGVVAGIRGVLRALDGDPGPHGRRVLVQGLGGVGRRVAAHLIQAGATVLGADPDPGAQAAGRRLGVHLVPASDALSTPCDVFAPCALGGVLTPKTAQTLPARAVCGSANNPLSDPQAGLVLHQRGVLYAPDLVVNVGAVAEGVLTVLHGATDAVRRDAAQRIDRVEETLADILGQARERGVAPERLAWELALERAAVGSAHRAT